MSLLGVDVGTSGLKAVAFRADDGQPIASASRAYRPSHPAPGRMELDPELVWQAFIACVREVAADPAVDGDRVTALALSVSCDEVIPVDAEGRALAPCIMAPDTRGADALEELGPMLPEAETYARTGLPLAAIHPLVRIAWYRRHQPRTAARARRWLGWGELIMARLGLPPTTDATTAGRWLAFDVRSGTWMTDILAALDLGGRVPAVAPPGTPLGHLGASAGTLGLDADVAVVAGAFDQVCAAIGAGLREPGDTVVGSGTWENTTIVLEGPLGEPARERGITWGPYLGDRYAALVMNPAGGSVVRWLGDALGETKLDLPDRPTSILFLPHLAGSLAPWRDPRSKGAFVGLTFATTRQEMAAAALEGVTYELRLNLEPVPGLPPLRAPIRNTGGGARSRAWVQLKADVLGQPVATVGVDEPGCLGAAILAGVGSGILPDAATAQLAWCRVAELTEPDPAAVIRHEERFALYRELYPAIRRISAAL